MDLSLWKATSDGFVVWASHGFAYWRVSKNNLGRWYWCEIITDEWDAVNEVEYEFEVDRSEGEFDTWEEAAWNCQNGFE